MNELTLGRRSFLRAAGGALASLNLRAQTSMPNVVFILADDLGYGDLGCYGSSIPTPNIDQLAQEGVRLTRFYSAAPVCSPSRAALLTGRYPVRTGVVNVLMPTDGNGLKSTEQTLPKVLRQQGYRTGCVGKWHLGSQPSFMPNQHGFDEFYGLPYSNDMNPLPMLRNLQVVENSAEQAGLTDQFTDYAVDFIGRNKEHPFFLYLAHTAPHLPLVACQRMQGKSGQGTYGDLVAELDDSVGRVMQALKANGLDGNTLVIFTSDNGPWYQGSTGNLQGRKGSTYEGGVREPFLARLPGRIPAKTVNSGVSSMMDMLPTVASLCGASISAGSVDGVDLLPALTGSQPYVDRDPLLFFDGWNLQCVRFGPWKLHLARYNSFAWTDDPAGGRFNLRLPNPELYNIDEDPGENYDRSGEKAQFVTDLRARVDAIMAKMPADAQNAWRDTLARPVWDTPAGALPHKGD